MDKRNDTLQVLYKIVKEETHPTNYHCTPREMILHSTFDWEIINKHLELLEQDGSVKIQHGDAPSFSITEKGMSLLLENPITQKELQPFLLVKEAEEQQVKSQGL